MTKRAVYLPEGVWYDYWTGEKLTGPVWFLRDAPLDTCPIYVKAGTILPLMEEQSYVGEKPLDTLTVMVWQGHMSIILTMERILLIVMVRTINTALLRGRTGQ